MKASSSRAANSRGGGRFRSSAHSASTAPSVRRRKARREARSIHHASCGAKQREQDTARRQVQVRSARCSCQPAIQSPLGAVTGAPWLRAGGTATSQSGRQAAVQAGSRITPPLPPSGTPAAGLRSQKRFAAPQTRPCTRAAPRLDLQARPPRRLLRRHSAASAPCLCQGMSRKGHPVDKQYLRQLAFNQALQGTSAALMFCHCQPRHNHCPAHHPHLKISTASAAALQPWPSMALQPGIAAMPACTAAGCCPAAAPWPPAECRSMGGAGRG